MQWLQENWETIQWVLYVVVPAVMGLLVKWGLIEKKAKETVEEGIEDVRPLLELAVANARTMDDEELSPKRIADIAIHAVKTRVRERRAEQKPSVQLAISDGAAKCDPDPEKKPRPVLRFLGGLVKATLLKR